MLGLIFCLHFLFAPVPGTNFSNFLADAVALNFILFQLVVIWVLLLLCLCCCPLAFLCLCICRFCAVLF